LEKSAVKTKVKKRVIEPQLAAMRIEGQACKVGARGVGGDLLIRVSRRGGSKKLNSIEKDSKSGVHSAGRMTLGRRERSNHYTKLGNRRSKTNGKNLGS